MSHAAVAGVEGFAPSLRIDGPTLQPGHAALVGNGLTEAEKYRLMWQKEQYRAVAPGEGVAPLFLQQARPKPGSEVIDFGTGTGRGAFLLAALGALKVRMLDFAENCLDEDIRQIIEHQAHVMCFAKQDLVDPIPWTAQYGYCCDVLEHIPPRQVDTVLTNILKAAQHVFFQISCVDDVCGALIGQPLHLSVHPYSWWLKKFQEDFECVIHWSEDRGDSCLFYLSAWMNGQQLTDAGVLNVEEDEIRANVRANTSTAIQQCKPHALNETECMILGGGPSLAENEAEIRRLLALGVKIVTLNGAYNWAVSKGLQVGAQIVVDAREFNRRFVEPAQDGCKYLLASQCHPSLYAACPADRTYQWHTTTEIIRDILDENVPEWYAIPGGSTVLLRAIPLLRMLGFKSFHLFGCDSCISSGVHHAYAQPENDGAMVIPTIVGGRTFQCHAWHASQANEFVQLVRVMGDEIELEIYGDGLLAWIMKYGHDLELEKESKTIGESMT